MCNFYIEFCVILCYNMDNGEGQLFYKPPGGRSNHTMPIVYKIDILAALKELEDLIEQAKAEADALRDDIKTEMLNRNTEEMEAGQYIIRWTSVLSQRFDTTGFKKSHADLYKEFTKQIASRRFSIA